MDITEMYLRERYPNPSRETVKETNKNVKSKIEDSTKDEIVELLDQLESRLGDSYLDKLIQKRVTFGKGELSS